MRNIRIAAVSFELDDTPHTITQNLDRALKCISDAAARNADIVCLPESVTVINTPQQKNCGAEPASHPWTTAFAMAALKNHINVIAPYYVKDGNHKYNQATVFHRDGSIAGWYRKVQPHAQELKHVAPGNDFPIITLDIGRIAIMICFDIYFPEIARIYAMKGAEILFWPTMTVGPTQSGLKSQLVSRAVDNSLHIVEANYAQKPPYAPHAGRWRPGNARIIDFNGETLAQTGRRPGLAIADIDLDVKRVTSEVVLRHNPDRTRQDIEDIARMKLYAGEYLKLSKRRGSK